ncbi:MAG: hypothetical protein ACKPKO_31390, partial [Candidatus Fonsibacter sp.]
MAAFILADVTGVGPASSRGWKLMLLLDRLLFGGLQGRPGRESTLSSRVAERFDLFWRGQWQTLWLQSSPSRRGDAQPTSGPQRAKRIARLVREQNVAKGISALLGTASRSTAAEVSAAFCKQCGMG